jgi:tRNA threonylcarbamoyladenosine biosynthesis protein TsaE
MSAASARVTASPAETRRLGAALGAALRAGDVVVLEGPLGSGKTCFVGGVAEGMRVEGRVRSPSFTLVNEYAGDVPLFHLDLYRVETPDVDGLGIEERLERGAVVVEWGGKLPAHLRAEALTLRFAIAAPEVRQITAGAGAGRGRELLAAWAALERGAALES